MRKSKARSLALLVLVVALAGCATPLAPESGLVDGRLRECPDSPNCVSSMAPEDDEQHYIEPFSYSGTRSEAREKLLDIIDEQDRAEILASDPDYLHVAFTTPVMRFVDDVEFYLPGGENVIHVRSASRVGYSDLGTNRGRVEELREAFDE